MEPIDQFVRRGYLKERFADGGPEKRLIVIRNAPPSAIQSPSNRGIFLDQTQEDKKSSLFLTQILLEGVLKIKRNAKKQLRATQYFC
jgi:hypothetical protein